RGEKSTIVVFWKRLVDIDPETGKESAKFFLRYYNVFNTDQCDFDEIGQTRINELSTRAEERNHVRSQSAQDIIASMPDAPKIIYDKSGRASYNRDLDRVRLPEMKYFASGAEFYATLFHELVHASGHSKRTGRFDSYKAFDDSHMRNYSREELVAELGASYLAAVAGLDHDINNSAAYLKGWASRLTENTNWIIWASSRAQKATEFILNTVAVPEVAEV
nr:hypothetical protein [Bacteroidota bacterium]